jgi:predicted ATPase
LLTRLKITGFKSLCEETVVLPRLLVLFGPNAAGKSNLLDAVQALSRIGTSRTVSDALSEPIRGHAIEAFNFPAGGLPELLSRSTASFSLEADLGIGKDQKDAFRYRVEVAIQPGSGSLNVTDEYLTALTSKGEARGNPSIDKVGDQLRIRRKSKPAHPRQEPVGLNHTLLSDPRLSGVEYRAIERCREELLGWRVYYLDPRIAMRSAKPPAEVSDIGVLGEDIAPFLYRLRAEYNNHFKAIKRTLRTLIPSIENLDVDLDTRRGTLDIQIRQGGVDFSSRIISEGTLRVLALCATVVNPWGGSLIAFEEPENGVHPRRIELIAKLLLALTTERRGQVIVTTHSPLFCESILREARSLPDTNTVSLFNVRQGLHGSTVKELDTGPLFETLDIEDGLTTPMEDGAFERLLLRGLIDG